jgi:type IV secretion system protein VirB5
MLDQVYGFVAGAAQTFLDDYYGKRSPFDVMKDRTISVDIGAILELSDKSFQLQWRETARSLEGRVMGRKTFQGIFTVRVDPPRTENRTNPLGIFITHISWTEA